MKLRNLDEKDAPLMLEWMHDPSVVQDLQANFAAKELSDCEKFIQAAQDTSKDMHLAIIDNNDEYMGTVSLKHITTQNAELGIIIRKCAMGQGYSKFAMNEISRVGFEELGINEVYWCVCEKNDRAVRFYDKNEYLRVDINKSNLLETVRALGTYNEEQLQSYIWYVRSSVLLKTI